MESVEELLDAEADPIRLFRVLPLEDSSPGSKSAPSRRQFQKQDGQAKEEDARNSHDGRVVSSLDLLEALGKLLVVVMDLGRPGDVLGRCVVTVAVFQNVSS